MTATVTLLSSRRKQRAEQTCRYCAPGWTCGPHRLLQLAERLNAARGTDLQDEAITDALAVIEQITAVALPDERTAR